MQGPQQAGSVRAGLMLAVTLVLLSPGRVVADEPTAVAGAAPWLRVFLKDGRSLVSFGEYARVDSRVVFSMPTDASAIDPELHLVDLAADRVDWERTERYAESARATRYLQTRAEADYGQLTGQIADVLNEVGAAADPRERLAIVQRARKSLSDWPAEHYNYKRDEIRSMLGLMDEAIADLRAATGAERFDVSLFTAMAAAPPLEALLPPPTLQEMLEQTLAVALLTDVPAERTSLLTVVVGTIDRRAAELPDEWAKTTRASASAMLTHELALDRAYRLLGREMLDLATARAHAADVRGVERILALADRRDAALGSQRPDALNGIRAAVHDQLDAARRLRLSRDAWTLRLPELRAYRLAITPSLNRLTALAPALEDIKALSGSGPDALGAILRAASAAQTVLSKLTPPSELADLHALIGSAVQMADLAARVRREAALTGDMDRAWNASSAAAGALMLSRRAVSDLQTAFRMPQLPR